MFTRLRLLAGAAIVAVFPFVSAASATTIWQIGVENGAVAPEETSEFLHGDVFHAVFNYFLNGNPDNEVNNPAFIGYLSDRPLSSIDPGRTQIQSAETINLIFSLESNYNDVTFTLNRYGSETFRTFVDFGVGPLSSSAGPGEGLWQSLVLDLGNLTSGVHIITLQYAGGGTDNGDYLDSLALSGTAAVPEPATSMLFIGGALAAVRARRARETKAQSLV